MCETVKYGDRWYTSPRALAEIIGGAENLIWRDKDKTQKSPGARRWGVMDLCLCSIDLEKTLASAGFDWTKGRDPMEWHVVERSPPP
jgi:hypothetical protein